MNLERERRIGYQWEEKHWLQEWCKVFCDGERDRERRITLTSLSEEGFQRRRLAAPSREKPSHSHSHYHRPPEIFHPFGSTSIASFLQQSITIDSVFFLGWCFLSSPLLCFNSNSLALFFSPCLLYYIYSLQILLRFSAL